VATTATIKGSDRSLIALQFYAVILFKIFYYNKSFLEEQIPFRTFDKFFLLNLDNDTKKTLDRIFESTSPNRVSRSLMRIFIGYLESNHTNLPIDFDQMLFDLEYVFQILDMLNCQKEKQLLE
jgi:hypothetical protein